MVFAPGDRGARHPVQPATCASQWSGGGFRKPINCRALETSVELRSPALERVFDRRLFGRKLKHMIEPRVVYRRVIGVDNFSKILRFDERGILTNTNEVEYTAVTRLFAKRSSSATAGCSAATSPSSIKFVHCNYPGIRSTKNLTRHSQELSAVQPCLALANS
jgi:hypothetical protein